MGVKVCAITTMTAAITTTDNIIDRDVRVICKGEKNGKGQFEINTGDVVITLPLNEVIKLIGW